MILVDLYIWYIILWIKIFKALEPSAVSTSQSFICFHFIFICFHFYLSVTILYLFATMLYLLVYISYFFYHFIFVCFHLIFVLINSLRCIFVIILPLAYQYRYCCQHRAILRWLACCCCSMVVWRSTSSQCNVL